MKIPGVERRGCRQVNKGEDGKKERRQGDVNRPTRGTSGGKQERLKGNQEENVRIPREEDNIKKGEERKGRE